MSNYDEDFVLHLTICHSCRRDFSVGTAHVHTFNDHSTVTVEPPAGKSWLVHLCLSCYEDLMEVIALKKTVHVDKIPF